MHRRQLIHGAAAIVASAALPGTAFAATNTIEETTQMTDRPSSGYAPVNGVEIYYELHGSGKPLVLLHGGLGSIEMFGPVLTALAEGRQVIGVDLQAHGRTRAFDRPMTFANLATDIAELIKWLGHEKADVMGYSLGGMTALRVGLDHPDMVDRLVLVSAAYAFAGWHDYNQQGMKQMSGAIAEMMKQTPMYEAYARLSPAPEEWAKSLDQVGGLTGSEYDWAGEIPSLNAPTLLVYGDWDAVRTSHAASFFELLGGGKQDANWDGTGMNANRLAILPGATHYSIFMDPRLAATATGFLET
jgi:pimeloyl-ACP methyl ester carboxylesterase